MNQQGRSKVKILDRPLRPSHRMSGVQAWNIFRLFSTLYFEYRAQVDVFAKAAECPADVYWPDHREDDQRRDKRREYERSLQDKIPRHEDEEDDNTPYETREGDGPSLPLGLVRFIEYCIDVINQQQECACPTHQKEVCICIRGMRHQSKWSRISGWVVALRYIGG
jgi:hypothetical protein